MYLQQTYSEKEYSEHIIKTYLDKIVLAMLNGQPAHGYQIIADLHRIFGVLLSPGTLYPLLYDLEEKNLVQVNVAGRRKVYSLTSKGKKKILYINKLYKRDSKRIFNFIDRNLEISEEKSFGYR